MSQWVDPPDKNSALRVPTMHGEFQVTPRQRAAVSSGFPVLHVIVDAAFRVVSLPISSSENPESGHIPLTDIYDPETGVVREFLHLVLRNLWDLAQACGVQHRVVIPRRYAVSLTPLYVNEDLTLAVLTFEATRSSENLYSAVARFALTERETQILALMCDGTAGPQMASILNLAESTIHSYFKRLLEKTNSPNRYAMVAKILGWQSSSR